MKRVVQIIACLLLSGYVSATHIVGGEFEIRHSEGNTYLFRQIQYFDVINGNPEAKDQLIDASIFRKSDNLFVRSVLMRYQSESYVPYTNPECTNDRLVTNRIIYSAEVTLDPELFSDPGGYYMVWERCCRNNIITNIVRPEETGQTFYIEFPPIQINGEPFINSTPQLFPPLSDYACVNRFYYVDFRGFDPDGDSLVYSLATPSNSSAFEPLPIPTPAPHPQAIWVPGINSNYQIPGTPTLGINDRGFLTVTPSEEGLFVFSVRCEEYRNGMKIGEVTRDFQLFVIDCPDPGNPPEIQVKPPASDIFTSELDTIYLATSDNKCFNFKIADKDGSETISLRAEAVNFEENVQSILSADIDYLDSPEDTMSVQVCLPDCPYVQGEPFIIDIIAQDFTCPLPLMDTMRLIVMVEPPPNKSPKFIDPTEEQIVLSFPEGSEISLPFSAIDEDGDSLILEVAGDDFSTTLYGIEIDTLNNANGALDFKLNWNTDCNIYPFAFKDDFEIKLYIEDADQCMLDNRDSIILNIKIELPANNVPAVLVNNNSQDQEVTVRVGEELLLDVRAFDGDPTDLLLLEAVAENFELEETGIVFENKEGNSNIHAAFSWEVDCDAVNAVDQGKYDILFVAEDADKCKVPNADTLKLTVNVLPPINHAPEIIINDEVVGDTIDIDAGNLLNMELLAFDQDQDSISVRMLNKDISDALGVVFQNSSGRGNLYNDFSWQTDCSLLGADFADSSYNFSVVAEDYKCLVPKADTLEFTLRIVDEDIDYNILPPNAFTPNAEDAINESYFVPGLPGNNCRRQFKEVVIINRYGKEVFSSSERDFHWYAAEYPTGVYYYIISYTDFSVRGTISLLK